MSKLFYFFKLWGLNVIKFIKLYLVLYFNINYEYNTKKATIKANKPVASAKALEMEPVSRQDPLKEPYVHISMHTAQSGY